MANLKIGDKALAFSLPSVDGTTVALGDYSDKAALAVVFHCNHCPYAQAWEGRLIEIQADYADRGVQLVAINANDASRYPDDSFDAMKERAAEYGYNFPYLHDESQAVASAYGAERTPEVFLFDGGGTLVYHGAPDDNYEEPHEVKVTYLRDALDAVLAGQPVPIAETKPVGCSVKWKS